MKRIRGIAGVLLVVIMVFTLIVPVFAANDYSIIVKNENTSVSINGKSYNAYKLFEATYNTDTKAIAYTFNSDTCLNVTYDGKSGQDLIAYVSQLSSSDLRAFADTVYRDYIKDSSAVKVAGTAVAENETANIKLETAGYYLVYGTSTTTDANASEVTAAVSLISTQPTATVTPKLDVPTLDKKIKHNELGSWGTVGDNQIGDKVEYLIETSVPSVEGYSTYSYVIHDKMDAGLTYNNDAKIYLDADLTKELTSHYDVKTTGLTHSECTFEIIVNIKGLIEQNPEAKTLYTSYSATLNENAIIYTNGSNDNIAYLQYSNNPYDSTKTSTTPEVKVYDWTYQFGVNKVNGEKTPLNGAKFVLSKNNKLDVKLENGTLNSTTNLIALTDNGNKTYSIDKEALPTANYIIEAGNITIKGLDDATNYYLYEVQAPDGYNLLSDPIKFEIVAEYNNNGANVKDGFPMSKVNDVENPSMITDVVNNSGTVLPETGGMGTTVFYIIGGILMLAAAVLLITRRRMSAQK